LTARKHPPLLRGGLLDLPGLASCVKGKGRSRFTENSSSQGIEIATRSCWYKNLREKKALLRGFIVGQREKKKKKKKQCTSGVLKGKKNRIFQVTGIHFGKVVIQKLLGTALGKTVRLAIGGSVRGMWNGAGHH